MRKPDETTVALTSSIIPTTTAPTQIPVTEPSFSQLTTTPMSETEKLVDSVAGLNLTDKRGAAQILTSLASGLNNKSSPIFSSTEVCFTLL